MTAPRTLLEAYAMSTVVAPVYKLKVQVPLADRQQAVSEIKSKLKHGARNKVRHVLLMSRNKHAKLVFRNMPLSSLQADVEIPLSSLGILTRLLADEDANATSTRSAKKRKRLDTALCDVAGTKMLLERLCKMMPDSSTSSAFAMAAVNVLETSQEHALEQLTKTNGVLQKEELLVECAQPAFQ